MGYYSKDPYYNPEDFGLRVIDSMEDPNASYSFDTFVVWQHYDGRVFYASDSGCSCPSPFEYYNSLEDLSEVTPGTWDVFLEAVDIHCRPWNWSAEDMVDALQKQRVDIKLMVAELLDIDPYGAWGDQ